MGILDALKGLTRPYDDEDEFFDDEEELMDEEEHPAKAAGKGGNPFFDSDTPEYDSPDPEPAPIARPAFTLRKDRERDGGKVNRMPGSTPANKIVFLKPDRYEDTKVIYDHLRSRRIVLMSLDNTNKEIARRILDFMAGAAYASEGKIARISSGTYIITPKNVDMMGSDMMEELENNGLFF